MLRRLSEWLRVEDRLRLYAQALQAPEEAGTIKGAEYFLLELDLEEHKLKITGYKNDELEKASTDYLAVEQQTISGIKKRDAVLIAVDSFKEIKRAFPNYYLDTHRFLGLVQRATEIPAKRRSVPNQLGLKFVRHK